MRSAPSVTYPVGRSSFLAVILLGCASLSLLVLMLWCWLPVAQDRWGAVAVGMSVSWLLWASWAYWFWRTSPVGSLEWRANEGASGAWFWHGSNDATALLLDGGPDIALDLQRMMIIRFSSMWLCLQSGDNQTLWWSVRRALVAGRRR